MKTLLLCLLAVIALPLALWCWAESKRQRVATPYDREDGLEFDRRLPGN